MFGPSIKLSKEMYEQLKKCAEAGGYSSADEFALHIIERELEKIEDGASDEEIVKKLQGLGYLE